MSFDPGLPFRGRWPVAGLRLGLGRARGLPSKRLAERLAGLWTPGCRVLRFGPDWVLLFEQPREMRAEHCPGEPLIPIAGHLLARNFGPRERWTGDLEETLERAPSEAIVGARAGRLEVLPTAAGVVEDPASLLDLDAYAWFHTEALPEPAGVSVIPDPELVPTLAPAEAARGAGLAETIEGIPSRSTTAESWLLRWQDRQKKDSYTGNPAPSRGDKSSAAGWWRALTGLLRALGGGRIRQQKPASARSRPSPPTAASAHAAELGLLRRILGIPGRLLSWLGLARLMGLQHMRHLGRLFEHLHRGDIEEALRHAIPLARKDSSHRSPISGSPGFIGPRSSFRIGGGSRQISPFGLSTGVFETLRSRYRDLAAILEERGDLDRAAFVWAELLDEPARAVDMLERHGRIARAAEIAEICHLPPERIVSLWLRAGEKERALDIARARGAFETVIEQLGHGDAELASELRRSWAEELVVAGDPARAVTVLWPAAEHRHLIPACAVAADASGGPDAARVLPFHLAVEPERAEELIERARQLLLDEDGPDAPTERAFVLALDTVAGSLGSLAVPTPSGEPPRHPIARLSGRVLRWSIPRMLGTREAGAAATDAESPARHRLHLLARHADDPALAYELRALERRDRAWPVGGGETPRQKPRIIKRHLEPPTRRPSRRLWDAALLPSGDLLLAEGEAGLRLLRFDGKPLRSIAEPAHHLIVAPSGHRAVVLAEREDSYRLARIDTSRSGRAGAEHAGRLGPFAEMRLDAWSPTYDGGRLLVAGEGSFQILDAVDKENRGARVLWRLPDLGGRVLDIAHDRSWCTALVVDNPLRTWHLDDANVLRAKRDLELDFAQAERAGIGGRIIGRPAVHPAGQTLLVIEPADGFDNPFGVLVQNELVVFAWPLEEGARLGWCGDHQVEIHPFPDGEPGFVFGLYELAKHYGTQRRPLAEITFEGARRVGWRPAFRPPAGEVHRLLVWDDLGRLLGIDFDSPTAGVFVEIMP